MIYHKHTRRFSRVIQPHATRGHRWASAALMAAVVLVSLAHRSVLAGGFAPAETNVSPEPIMLAEFRAPVAVSLGGPTFPTTVTQPAPPSATVSEPASVSESAAVSEFETPSSSAALRHPAPVNHGFRAPDAGPDDEVVARPSGLAVLERELPTWASLPASDPLDIELTPPGAPLNRFDIEPSGGSSLTGGPLASLAAVAPNEQAWPPYTLPAYIASLPPEITRLPSLEDVSLSTDAIPTLADPGDDSSLTDAPVTDTSSDDTAGDETAATSSGEVDSEAELPAPAADSELVEGIVVEGETVDGETIDAETVEGEVIETYGWGYFGTWLNERFIPERIEAGGTYASGTRESWSALIKARWTVKEDRYDDELTFDGVYTEIDNERSNNEWIARDTFDWKAPDNSPWRLFIKGHAEYDEIEKLSFRGTASTGVGYAWINEDDRELTTRVGPSYTYERYFDPSDTNDKPELLAEVEFKWTFFGSLVLEHQTSAYPAFEEEDGMRINDETGLLTPIGTSPFWSWKLGLRHQYNDKPNTDVERNEYQASLLLVYDR